MFSFSPEGRCDLSLAVATLQLMLQAMLGRQDICLWTMVEPLGATRLHRPIMKEDLWMHWSSSSETCVQAGGQSQEAVPRQGCCPVNHSFPGCLRHWVWPCNHRAGFFFNIRQQSSVTLQKHNSGCQCPVSRATQTRRVSSIVMCSVLADVKCSRKS